MADMKCPKCGRKTGVKVNDKVKSYLDPHFSCRCGYKGKLYWTRKKA